MYALKRMRVRERDVPYMTTAWKEAIRKKRKYVREFSKNSSDENLALKRKLRNEATRQRRIAIKEYWDRKALELKSFRVPSSKPARQFCQQRMCRAALMR